MVKQFNGLCLLCVPIAQRTNYAMKNKPVFYLNYGNCTYCCVRGVLHPIILNTNSLITVKLCC